MTTTDELQLRPFLGGIADAIREVEESEEDINAQEFVERIKALSGGGGGTYGVFTSNSKIANIPFFEDGNLQLLLVIGLNETYVQYKITSVSFLIVNGLEKKIMTGSGSQGSSVGGGEIIGRTTYTITQTADEIVIESTNARATFNGDYVFYYITQEIITE